MEDTMARSTPVMESATYWEALQASVCSVCLDRLDDGSCGLPRGTECAMKRHLPLIVEVVHSVDSPQMDGYVAAVETEICRRCTGQDAAGQCPDRDHGRCALYAYLPLVVDAIESEDDTLRGTYE
jgi:hypothetical protein